MNLSLRHQSQIYLGLFEREIHPWLVRLSANINTAVDVGAAHGEYTLFFLQKTHATTVFAFEPDDLCTGALTANLTLNGLEASPKLRLSTKFVHGVDTHTQMRLDSLAHQMVRPIFIKVDVDGHEEKVLNGAAMLNSFDDTRWLIETHSRHLELECIGILSRAGFKTHIIPNAIYRSIVPEQRPIAHNRWLAAWKAGDDGGGC